GRGTPSSPQPGSHPHLRGKVYILISAARLTAPDNPTLLPATRFKTSPRAARFTPQQEVDSFSIRIFNRFPC
ncbi:MAG TPA: hypothetical protein VHU44_06765, partial [Acidobacteriaceae bacterium]|nr:hypothetical protein [Acidobacteriaceae bacterium]